MKSIPAAAALGLAVLGGATAALACHSFAAFDFAKQQSFQGTVKEFRWVNPHASPWVVRDPGAGKPPEVWNLELTSPGNLTRSGWNKRAFQVGERIQVTTNPLRNGQNGGSFVQATILKTGRSGRRICGPPTASRTWTERPSRGGGHHDT